MQQLPKTNKNGREMNESPRRPCQGIDELPPKQLGDQPTQPRYYAPTGPHLPERWDSSRGPTVPRACQVKLKCGFVPIPYSTYPTFPFNHLVTKIAVETTKKGGQNTQLIHPLSFILDFTTYQQFMIDDPTP
jgi:hypothetical protein